MNDAFVMRPGDRFVARDCGCAFVVDSGPKDITAVRQAPRCCCGHSMVKEGNTAREGDPQHQGMLDAPLRPVAVA